jgi:hypothetical protein
MGSFLRVEVPSQAGEKNQIPFHMVGTHRRLYARDVLAFKGRRDSARRKTLDDLSRTEFEQGTYDRVPSD